MLEKLANQLVKEIAEKHEEGEFLRDIVSKNPHLYNKTQKLLRAYNDLVVSLRDIAKLECGQTAIEQFDKWMTDLIKNKRIENEIYHDCHFTDIGENH